MIGRTLGGRYIVETRVGGGGMATVYRGMDTFLHRQVALKVLRNQFAGDADFVARFRREARAAASLSHPNIVAVYDVGQEGDDCYFIVQEFVDGQTLKEYIQREGRLPAPEALRITEQVLRALGQAHAAGIIHRDVKPQNVLMTRDGRVKVTDFGIAHAEAGATMPYSGAIVGTAHYAAPEQVRGQATDERCDIYSTGVMLYEMLTGTPPFDGEGPLAVALQHVERPVPNPAQAVPELPPGACALVRRAMGKQPDQRYQDTAQFEEDVVAMLAGRTPAHAVEALALQDPPAEAVPAGALDGQDGADAEPDPIQEDGVVRRSRRSRALRALGWVAGVLVLVGLVTSGAVLAMRNLLLVPTVTVPSVVGTDLTTAQQSLQNDGLQFLIHQESNATVPEGQVVETQPPAGTVVRKGVSVDVWESLGPPPVQVPDLSGLSQAAATTELTQMGLKAQVQSTPQFSPTVPAGSVLNSVPSAGAQVASGSTVTMTLSAGAPDTGGLPNYIGQALNAVEADLQQRQWTWTTTQQKTGFPAGVVAATAPTAGTPLLPGSSVALTVSSGCVDSQIQVFRAAAGPAAGTGGTPVVPPSGGLSPGSPPGFSTTSAGSSATGGSSATSTSSASSATGVSGDSEQVVLQDGSAPPHTVFNQVVPFGQSFQVNFCWASPSGATYTWTENGVTRQTQALQSPGATAAPGGQAGTQAGA